jgi:2-phospho-L-lactate/phosphoenolpyruvate guanylyltransferase
MSLTMLGDLKRQLDTRHGACAVIAVKQRLRCKMRLAEALAPATRIQLVRSMLATVVSAAGRARTVRQVIVVSPERDSVPAEIPVLADAGECLNRALTPAHLVLHEFGCREVVMLPADLPNITPADIDALVRAARRGGFAIVPDAAGVGTNALCLVSAHPFRFQFGGDSLRLHVREGKHLGLSPRVLRLPGLEFDVDSPADLDRLDGQRWLARRQLSIASS